MIDVAHDLPSILQFVRECRDLGAVSIAVGDVRVRFGESAYSPLSPDPLDDPAEEELTEEERQAREEERTYWSSGG